MRHIAASAIAIATIASTASAELVTVFCPGVGAGRNVSVTHKGAVRNVFAGQILLNLSNSASGTLNGSWRSFCTELDQYIYVNGAAQTYQALPLKDVPIPGAPMGIARAEAIGRMYAFANGAQYGTNADYAAAFQIAVWEVANDYTGDLASLSLAAGDLQGPSVAAAIGTHITTLLAAAGNVGATATPLFGLGNTSFQDQIIDPTSPIPTPGAIAMLGLAALVGSRGRRR
jgi:MYXO-CTERM domain-containing protein